MTMNMIGQLLDRRYRIVEVLSSGAFGQTYLAVDTRRPGHPQCVVKQLRPPSKSVLKNAQRLFKQEAEILEKLGRHDQIPLLLAYFEENQKFYLVEEFVPGHSLIKEIIAGQILPEEKVIDILESVLEILVFVHEQGVIHRDINPSNLIRRKNDNKLVLIDFGSVKQVADRLESMAGQAPRTIATGTPSYMPIEQFQGNPQFNSDIYALGMIAIQGLTGLPASDLPKLQAPNPSHTGEIVWRQQAIVSNALADIIDKMVHQYYGKRYQSAGEILVDLDKIGNKNFSNFMGNKNNNLQNFAALRTWLESLIFSPLSKWLLGGIVALICLFSILFILNKPDPDQAIKYYQSGLAKAKKGDREGAIADLEKSIKIDSKDAATYFNRGNIYYDRANSKADQGDGKGAEADYQAAIIDYNQVIRLNPKQASAYYNRAEAKQGLQNFQGAIEDYTQVIELQPNTPDSYYKRGMVYFDQQNYKTAIDDLSAAIRLQPNNTKAYNIRGLARAATGDWQGAMTDHTEAIRLDVNNADGYYNRGRARFHLGDYQGAIADYNITINLEPDSSDAYANRCSAKINLANYPSAIEDCTEAIRLNPENAIAYNNRCIAQFSLKDYQKSIEDCTKAIEINPQDSKSYSNRGLARIMSGDLTGAISDYSEGVQRNPNDAESYGNRANAYFQMKDYPKAIGDYAQSIRINPKNAAAYYGRATVRKAMGDKAGAIDDFQKAGKLFLDQGRPGGFKDAQYQIEQIKLTK